MTEFAENQEEAEKQDCELKAFYRLLNRLRDTFPMPPMCICGDSLYTCGRFFTECKERGCSYLLRFKVWINNGKASCYSSPFLYLATIL